MTAPHAERDAGLTRDAAGHGTDVNDGASADHGTDLGHRTADDSGAAVDRGAGADRGTDVGHGAGVERGGGVERGAGTDRCAGPIRVLVVDDDALVRAGLTMILSSAADILVAGEAADGSQVPAAVAEVRPDVVLMDIRMPGVDGLAATERLRAPAAAGRAGVPEVIVLTTFDADEYVLRALRAGASGFLLKDTPPTEILRAVRRVASGEATLSPAVTRRLIAHVAAPAGYSPGGRSRTSPQERAAGHLAVLSERERDVAIALGQGRTNAEISADLHMSLATVKAYVSRLLTKLDLNNRVQVALLVHDAGWT